MGSGTRNPEKGAKRKEKGRRRARSHKPGGTRNCSRAKPPQKLLLLVKHKLG